MNRRRFVGAIARCLLAPVAASAQAPGRSYRLGMLAPSAAAPRTERKTAVVLIPAALAEMGYVPGQNLVVETRYADGKMDRLPALARELVAARWDVIVAIDLRTAKALGLSLPPALVARADRVIE